MKKVGHTPQWPNYFERSQKDRTLAILQGHILIVEHDGPMRVEDFAHLLSMMLDNNLLVFVQSLTDKQYFPYLYSAIISDNCDVSCTKEGHPISVKVKYIRGQSRWIIPTSVWDRKVTPTFLHEMRQFYTSFHMTKPTPGSMGQALMRRDFSQQHLPKHDAPGSLALSFLAEHGYGGRCDTLVEPGYYTPEALELDMSDGYLAHILRMITGTSYWFSHGHESPFVSWFGRCDITIKRTLPLGPFPVRTGKHGKIIYPTRPGTYHTYIWKEQAQDAYDAGCDIRLHSGVGWKYFTEDLTHYARYMHNNRMLLSGTPIEDNTKKTIVSGLGHFGMKQQFYRATTVDNGIDPCILNDAGNPLRYFARQYDDYLRPVMLHWYNYLIMQCARSLYKGALPYAEAGRLLMTNYDALLILEENERTRYPEKHSLESLLCEMGDWRWQALTNVTILGDRSLKCDQKVIRPGVSRNEAA